MEPFWGKIIHLSLAAVFCFASASHAENLSANESNPSTGGNSTLEVPVAAPAQAGRFIGSLEFRPSYKNNGEYHMENYAQLGYRFGNGMQVAYRQEYTANIFDPMGASDGLGLYAYDGSLRTKFGDVWKSEYGDWSLNMENRVYAPTFSVRRDAGMIAAVRQYFRLKRKVGDFAVTLEEVPILHFFSRAGTPNKRNGEANPWFENRVYVDFEYELPIKGLKFWLPIILESKRYRDFALKAKNNDTWGHKLYVYPELTYTLNSNLMVGLGYYSDNMIRSDFSAMNLEYAFSNGVTQMILSASI